MKHLRIATLVLFAALALTACKKSEPANTDTYAAPTNDTAAMNTSPAPVTDTTATTATNATSGTTVTSGTGGAPATSTTATTGSGKTGTY